MTKSNISRRRFIEGGAGLTVANLIPGTTPLALAASMEERTVAAAKAAGAADVSGMIWSPYLVPMQPVIAEFKKQTGIGVGGVQDISIFDAPQRAMAEALSRSPQFDFIHIDSNMIPSLASAGYLEPLDQYMKQADFKIEAVADYANFMTYKGQTYGIPTDGNVHIQYVRKDLLENPDNKKKFADKHGKELKFPETWEDDLRIQQTLMDPSKDLYGSGNLRNRANGPTWWYMIFYSAGGFTFDDDMNPTLPGTRGELPVLGRNRQAQREPRQVEDDEQVALRPGAGFGLLRQAHPSVDLITARRAAHQQVQPAQSPGRLSRALARLGQEQHPDRVRPGEHLQRCLGEGAHDRVAGDRRL